MEEAIVITIAFAFGGILKGATGAGAPILAVPMLVLYFDVPFAVTIFAVPNLVLNIWQGWAFREFRLPSQFIARFAIAGGLGTGFGTYILAYFSTDILSLCLVFIIFSYLIFRILRPSWSLGFESGVQIAAPVGILAGLLHGSAGISAPASLTFLNALHLERGQFISTISIFFVAMGIVQIPLLTNYGFLTVENFALSLATLIPLMIFMPVGAALARHISKAAFDRLILILLSVMSIKLLAETLS